MTDYSKCKIYKLVGECGGVYIGHTVRTLERRKNDHLTNLNTCVSKTLTNPEIYLLEDYPCLNHSEAVIREQFYMDLEPHLINKKRAVTDMDELKIQYRERYTKSKATNPNHNKEMWAKYGAKQRVRRGKKTPCPICGVMMNYEYINKHKKRLHSNQIPTSVGLGYNKPSDLNAV